MTSMERAGTRLPAWVGSNNEEMPPGGGLCLLTRQRQSKVASFSPRQHEEDCGRRFAGFEPASQGRVEGMATAGIRWACAVGHSVDHVTPYHELRTALSQMGQRRLGTSPPGTGGGYAGRGRAGSKAQHATNH